MRRARDEVSQLQAAGVVSVAIMDDADHTFSFRVPRLAVMRAITEHLCRRYPESSSPA
jgi:hypothetical protein